MVFDFASWKGKASTFATARLNEILETLMDDQNTIAAIQNKKHVKPFIESVVQLMALFD
jgi:dynein heavy chain